MNKEELIHAVAEKTELAKKDASKAVNAMLDTITETLASGEKLALTGFGTFQVKERAAREGRNPKTGEAVSIPAKNAPAFTPGKNLKEAVNE